MLPVCHPPNFDAPLNQISYAMCMAQWDVFYQENLDTKSLQDKDWHDLRVIQINSCKENLKETTHAR